MLKMFGVTEPPAGSGIVAFWKLTRDVGLNRRIFLMKNRILTSVAIAGLIALGACNKQTPAAENVADNYENVADNIEDVADNAATDNAQDALENKADAVRAMGDNKADAIDATAAQGGSMAEQNAAAAKTK
jgi:poly-gamma-glutamate capsule biosynthesis protein CapA/YwtB (metallophosphatase superfamily)